MKTFRSKTAIFLCSISVLFVALFYACGDGGISAKVVPASGEAILASDDIVVTFSKSMDPTTLELSGSMPSGSDEGTWSKTKSDNDTLTLSPANGWNSSDSATLTLDIKDVDGNDFTLDLEYTVTLKFSNFQKAKIVIGELNFTSSGGGLTAKLTDNPVGPVTAFGDKLFASDYGNNRILIYNSFPTTNGASANHVIGQTSLTAATTGAAANHLDGPITPVAYKNKFFVTDFGNNRVLIYNGIPTSSGEGADVVLGQTGFGLNAAGCTAKKMDSPYGLVVVDDKLIVADKNNNRVLIWNSIPTTSGKSPDIVLGQNSFTSCTENDDNQNAAADATPSDRTFNNPQGIWSDGKKLVVLDDGNHRALIWNTFPTSKFAKADIVLGQSDFEHFTPNDKNQDGTTDGTPNAKTFSFQGDEGAVSNGTQLFITDVGNNRVLIWNTFPTTSFKAADMVLGQNDFASLTDNDDDQNGTSDAGPTSRTLNYPDAISLVGNHLIVDDDGNNRFIVFNGQ